jgi:hypothetical protein
MDHDSVPPYLTPLEVAVKEYRKQIKEQKNPVLQLVDISLLIEDLRYFT